MRGVLTSPTNPPPFSASTLDQRVITISHHPSSLQCLYSGSEGYYHLAPSLLPSVPLLWIRGLLPSRTIPPPFSASTLDQRVITISHHPSSLQCLYSGSEGYYHLAPSLLPSVPLLWIRGLLPSRTIPPPFNTSTLDQRVITISHHPSSLQCLYSGSEGYYHLTPSLLPSTPLLWMRGLLPSRTIPPPFSASTLDQRVITISHHPSSLQSLYSGSKGYYHLAPSLLPSTPLLWMRELLASRTIPPPFNTSTLDERVITISHHPSSLQCLYSGSEGYYHLAPSLLPSVPLIWIRGVLPSRTTPPPFSASTLDQRVITISHHPSSLQCLYSGSEGYYHLAPSLLPSVPLL